MTKRRQSCSRIAQQRGTIKNKKTSNLRHAKKKQRPSQREHNERGQAKRSCKARGRRGEQTTHFTAKRKRYEEGQRQTRRHEKQKESKGRTQARKRNTTGPRAKRRLTGTIKNQQNHQ